MDLNLNQLFNTFFAEHPFYCTLLATISFFFIVVLFRGWPTWPLDNDEQETDETETQDNDDADITNPITGTYTVTLQDSSSNSKVLKITIKKDI